MYILVWVRDNKHSMADSTDYSSLLKPTPKYASKTPIGELYIRNVRRFTWLEWVYILLVSFSIVSVTSLSIKSLLDFYTGTNSSTSATLCNGSSSRVVEASCSSWICRADFIYAILLLVNIVFCTYYTFDGLFRERGFETIAYVVGVVAVVLYVIINFNMNQGTSSTRVFKLVRLVLVCIFAPPNILLAVMVWWRMGRLNFVMVGSNQTLLWAYQIRSVFVTLVVFNVELMASVTTLAFVRDSTFLSYPEVIGLPVVLSLTILLAIVTILTVSYEWKNVMYLYYPSSLVPTAYYVYKMVNVAVNLQYYQCTPDQYGNEGASYTSVAAVLLLACGLGTFAYVGIIPAAIMTHRNFAKGLKERVPPPITVNSRRA